MSKTKNTLLVAVLISVVFLVCGFSSVACYRALKVQDEISLLRRQNAMMREQIIKLIMVQDANAGNIISRIDDLSVELRKEQHASATALHWDLRARQDQRLLTDKDMKKLAEKEIARADEYFSKEVDD